MENPFIKRHDTAIIVTVYKNRYQDLIRHLSDNTDLWKYHDMILFRQDNDPATVEDYMCICETPNYQVVNCDAKDIREKRRAYYEWSIECNYDKIFVIDDDISVECRYADGTLGKSGKTWNSYKVGIEKMIDCMFRAADELDGTDEDWAVMSSNHSGYLGMAPLKEQDVKHINKTGYATIKNGPIYVMNVMINLKRTRLVPEINYQLGNVFEDKYFYSDCLLHKLNIYSLANYAVFHDSKDGRDSVVWDNSNEIREKNICQINQFNKYGGTIKLKNGVLTTTLRKSSLYGMLGKTPIINKNNPKMIEIMSYLDTINEVDANVEEKVREMLSK